MLGTGIWSGNPFIEFRLCLTLIWLAETNRAREVLVLLGPYLALAVGFSLARGVANKFALLNFIMLKGQRLTNILSLYSCFAAESIC